MNEVPSGIGGAADALDSSPQQGFARGVADGTGAATCRVLLDKPAEGAWNMAVDEMLLDQAAAGRGPFLRVYGWREPTLSIGYFQKRTAALDWLGAARRSQIPVVRRPSGGGAILHDREITYAFTLPFAAGRMVRGPALYQSIHRGLCVALQRHGIAARLRGVPQAPHANSQRSDQSFFCFLRSSEDDLLFKGRKAGGSAQRRRRGAVLQHGSLILAASPQLPEIAGLDLGETAERFAVALRPLIAEEIAAALELTLQSYRLDLQQQARATQIAQTKYGAEQWSQRR